MPFNHVFHKHVTIFEANRYDPVIKIIVAAGIATISLAWLISDVESVSNHKGCGYLPIFQDKQNFDPLIHAHTCFI